MKDILAANIMIFKMKDEVESISHLVRLKSANMEEDPSSEPISYSRTYGGTAYWLWGSERGGVTISVSAEGETKNGTKFINSHTETATDYISIGTSDSRVTTNSFTAGSSGHYDIAWAWYLATPLVSATIEFSGGNYTVKMGTALGSEAHGSGRSYITPNDLN
ncbi:hypothetical protein [Sunxiuqinia indica]|uniref:hypothetical protein n=1 Tax=Sunxiuqinia indica TaxID=2692584 RepID=UPI00135CDC9B|nr:hypothetical protein [Sunxiuqinia indica]